MSSRAIFCSSSLSCFLMACFLFILWTGGSGEDGCSGGGGFFSKDFFPFFPPLPVRRRWVMWHWNCVPAHAHGRLDCQTSVRMWQREMTRDVAVRKNFRNWFGNICKPKALCTLQMWKRWSGRQRVRGWRDRSSAAQIEKKICTLRDMYIYIERKTWRSNVEW